MMMPTDTFTMLDFQPITLQDKAEYERAFQKEKARGCEASFTNLYLWGDQRMARIGENFAIFSRFGDYCVYLYPVGTGDKRPVIDAIADDASVRGIPCRIAGIPLPEKEKLEAAYPGKFDFCAEENAFDYVYAIEDLAFLTGKKYDGKRNHLSRFRAAFPAHRAEPITKENRPSVRAMAEEWYAARESAGGDFAREKKALWKALDNYEALGLLGLALMDGDTVLAFTVSSFMTEDTLDVHFEKARPDAVGAYAAINNAFARYIHEKYPSVRFLDREEDMGIEGLRKAKRSYHPHHMVEKYKATKTEEVERHADTRC